MNNQDGDSFADFLDTDSDNDGISDVIENNGLDNDGDGRHDGFTDGDSDGFLDDVDTDNGGIPGTTLDNGDFDQDGLRNYLDIDSDNDGIADVVEALGDDADGDGELDGFLDGDGDGFSDIVDTDNDFTPGSGDGGTALIIPNTDGGSNPDFVDCDSDDDGVPDNVEAFSTAGYIIPVAGDDDGDGLLNVYDNDFVGTSEVVPYDHELDGIPDYRDTDSDNDSEDDIIEAHDTDGDGTPETVPGGGDLDNDGLDNGFDVLFLTGVSSSTNAGNNTIDPATDGIFADADAPGVGDLDFRESDTDNDGVISTLDPDDDNDGIADIDEGFTDEDEDGVPNHLDLDSDNDGITDCVEAGGADGDGDGIIDGFTDADTDGFHDGVDDFDSGSGAGEVTSGVPLLNGDFDGDGLRNTMDFDSDNDGVPDVIENGGLDFNGDGMHDFIATDSDNDGLGDIRDPDDNSTLAALDGPGTALTIASTDSDIQPNFLDLDSDNDGLSDIFENGGPDTDGDGMVDSFTDADNDGYHDGFDTDDTDTPVLFDGTGTPLTLEDFDQDTIVNYLDIDDDNDGITTALEAGGTDDNGDGQLDAFVDSDADGFHDDVDSDDNTVPGTGDGGTPLLPPNTDGTGGANYLDIDSDGDGIIDNIEGQTTVGYVAMAGTDDDFDGMDDAYDLTYFGTVISPNDDDGDGNPDYRDDNSDNDPEFDLIEGHDLDGDGTPETTPALADTDGDGLDDNFDAIVLGAGTANTNGGNSTVDPLTDGVLADADNPGVGDLDFREYDTDFDGVDDVDDIDSDNDGLVDAIEGTLDSDGDGFDDAHDIDSDGDGIVDNIEFQESASFIPPTGADDDNDGLDNAYDPDFTGSSPITTPLDFDFDGTPDYLDANSDNDPEDDFIEGHDFSGDGVPEFAASGTDSDNDGLDDAFDNVVVAAGTFATNAINGFTDPLADADYSDYDIPGAGDFDFREEDHDSDEIADRDDEDDDNDGIRDSVEDLDLDGDANPYTGFVDTDGDGLADIWDLDSDNDGIPDLLEAEGILDIDMNGITDGTNPDLTLINDTDLDGLDDTFDGDNGGSYIPAPDTDGDGLGDWQDLDADNDGIFDRAENDSLDGDNNGLVDSFGDANGDGWDDDENIHDLAFTIDGDNVYDYKDLDTDNDGIPDVIENGLTDTDGNGMVDGFTDADGDGADDANTTSIRLNFDGDPIVDVRDLDCDNDGITDIYEAGGTDLDSNGVTDAFADLDNDGWDDDSKITSPTDTDADGNFDHKSLDADGDGITDIVESGQTDSDGDGLVDDFDDDDDNGLQDDLFVNPPDFDGDGDPDFQDVDSDNDSVGDFEEYGLDTDGDGQPDINDTDDDNDGIPTIDEADVDGDGEYDNCDTDNNPDYLDPDPCELFVPEAFSPNGDGINDEFEIIGLGLFSQYKLTIVNPNGSKIWEIENDFETFWDGSTQFGISTGEGEAPAGTYYYILELDEGVAPVKGFVYLNR